MAKMRGSLNLDQVRENAVGFVTYWLEENVVTPAGINLTEEQFGEMMATVTRGLVAAYMAGVTDTYEGKNRK